jgi:hypothetical protein
MRMAYLATLSALLLMTVLATVGCGYSKSEYRRADAEAKAAQATTAERDAYSRYRIDMEKINLEREKAGLPPRPIPTMNEWRKMEKEKPPSTD